MNNKYLFLHLINISGIKHSVVYITKMKHFPVFSCNWRNQPVSMQSSTLPFTGMYVATKPKNWQSLLQTHLHAKLQLACIRKQNLCQSWLCGPEAKPRLRPTARSCSSLLPCKGSHALGWGKEGEGGWWWHALSSHLNMNQNAVTYAQDARSWWMLHRWMCFGADAVAVGFNSPLPTTRALSIKRQHRCHLLLALLPSPTVLPLVQGLILFAIGPKLQMFCRHTLVIYCPSVMTAQVTESNRAARKYTLCCSTAATQTLQRLHSSAHKATASPLLLVRFVPHFLKNIKTTKILERKKYCPWQYWLRFEVLGLKGSALRTLFRAAIPLANPEFHAMSGGSSQRGAVTTWPPSPEPSVLHAFLSVHGKTGPNQT